MKWIFIIFFLLSYKWVLALQIYKDFKLLKAYGLKHQKPLLKINLVDYDDDFDADLIIGDISGNFYLYENVGTDKKAIWQLAGTITDFITKEAIDVISNSAGFAVDYDKDGDYDLICGNNRGSVTLYENTKNNFLLQAKQANLTTIPSIISSLKLQGNAYSIDIKDDLIAVAADKFVYLYDVSNPFSCKLKATIEIRGKEEEEIGIAYDVKIRSGYLYIAAGKTGLVVWDIRNIEEIEEEPIASLGLEAKEGSARKIAFSQKNDYAYIACGKAGLWIVDVSNPREEGLKTVVSWQPTPLPDEFSAYDLKVVDDYVYLAANYYGLCIIDAKNPQDIKLVRQITPPARGTARGVFYNPTKGHGYIYVASDEGGLQVINPSDFSVVATIPVAGFSQDVYIDAKNIAYIACAKTSVQGIDISNINNPKHIYHFKTEDTLSLYSQEDKLLYIADGKGGIKIIDIKSANEAIDVGDDSSPLLFDIDEDGYLDLFVGNHAGIIYFYKNIKKEGILVDPKPWENYLVFRMGHPIMELATFTTNLGYFGTVCDVGQFATPYIIDLNKDGTKDIICGNKEGEVFYFEGIGLATVTVNSSGIEVVYSYLVKPGKKLKLQGKNIDVGMHSSIAFADIDMDSEEELIVANEKGYFYCYDKYNDLNFYQMYTLFGKERLIKPKDAEYYKNAYIHFVDFNNDAKKDVLIGNKFGYIDLWLNYGSPDELVLIEGQRLTQGTYNAVPLDVGYNASLWVYDWNDDGKKDLLAGNSQGEILIYLNEGDDENIIFSQPTKLYLADGNIAKIGYDSTICAVDWDNDGDVDLLVGDRYGKIHLLRNRGDKRFEEEILKYDNQRVIEVSKNAAVYVTDFNQDNKKDLILGARDGCVWVLINYGSDESPIFKEAKKLQAASDIDVGNYSVVNLLDINNDLIDDLLISNEFGEIYFYPGISLNTPPSLSIVSPKGTQTGYITIKYTLCDDEFNTCDIEVYYSEDFGLTYHTATSVVNIGEGKQGLRSSKEGIVHTFVWDSIKDIGKTKKEIIIKMIAHDGKSFSTEVKTEIFIVDNTKEYYLKKLKAKAGDIDIGNNSAPVVIDWNNDGKKDLLIGNRQGFLTLFLNKGEDNSPKFEDFYNLPEIDVGEYANPYVCDYNNDGKKDLLVGNKNGQVLYYQNIGEDFAPKFATQPTILKLKDDSPIDVGYRSSLQVIDWNNDYKKDLLIGNSEGYIHLYINEGEDASAEFTTSVILKDINNNPLKVPNNANIFVIDWNKNNKKDLLIGAEDGLIYLYINIGEDKNPQFDFPSIIKIEGIDFDAGEDAAPFIEDWNNDGINDIICGNKEGNVLLYQIKKPIVNTPPKVKILPMVGVYTGTITINFKLIDQDGDTCKIKVFYSTNTTNWSFATFEDKERLFASPSGIYSTITWYSTSDVKDYLGLVYLKIIPYDDFSQGEEDIIYIKIDNLNRLPRIENLQVKSGEFCIISFDLIDLDNDECCIKVEYKKETEEDYKLAHIIAKGSITNPGFIYKLKPKPKIEIIWLSSVDEPNKKSKYKIKITPSDDNGRTFNIEGKAESSWFIQDNRFITSKIIKSKTKKLNNKELNFLKTKLKLLEEKDFDIVITVYEDTLHKIKIRKLEDLSQVELYFEVGLIYKEVSDKIERNYRIFIKEDNTWKVLPTKRHDLFNNIIFAELNTSFCILTIRTYSKSVQEIIVYPNPYKAGYDAAGNKLKFDGIVFTNVPLGTQIKIYDLLGRCVEELFEEKGECRWSLQDIGSGIYFYVAKKGDEVKCGEIVVIK